MYAFSICLKITEETLVTVMFVCIIKAFLKWVEEKMGRSTSNVLSVEFGPHALKDSGLVSIDCIDL